MKQYDPPFYKVVFFSSAPIGVPFLEQMAKDTRFDIVGVVTAPDRPSGRWLEVKSNVVKETAQQYIEWNLCRYFLLKDSLAQGREEKLQEYGITRSRREDRWVIIYGNKDHHERNINLFQSLMVSGPWYFDTRWAYNLIVYKESVFDLQTGEDAAAKEYGRSIGIPEAQLDRSAGSNEKAFDEYIQTPQKINPEKSEEGKQFTEWLKSKDADFFVVIAYGKIMPQAILDIPKLGPINVHPSLLPKFRGASPIISALLNNETMTGITIMYMNDKMDEGDEIAKIAFSVDFSWNEADLSKKMEQIWPEFLCNTLWDFGKEHLTRKPQDHTHATHATKFTKEDGKVDPRNDTLQIIYNKYRAFYRRPKIFFIYNEKRVIIESLVLDQKLFEPNASMVDENNALHSSIIECIAKPEWKKEMKWSDFVRGYMG